MDLTVASFDDPSRFQARHAFRRREHARGVARHLAAAAKSDRRISAAGRAMDRGDGRAAPDERPVNSSLDRVGRRRACLARDRARGGRSSCSTACFPTRNMNWIKFGHADAHRRGGFRVIMPDLRAHGLSGKPHELPNLSPRHPWPRPARTGRASRPRRFDLGGFSLGARTTVEAVGEGLQPRRAVLGGMGLEGLRDWERRKISSSTRSTSFDTVQRGDPHWLAIQFMKTMKVDRVAAALLLATFEDAHRRLARRLSPCRRWCVCGDRGR